MNGPDTATLLHHPELPVTRSSVSLTRVGSLKLGRDICRSFLKEHRIRPALAACADAIARAIPVSKVTLSAVTDDDEPVVVSCPARDSPECARPADLPPHFECSVPIHGEDKNFGILAVMGALPRPAGVEPFLEEIANEIGRCLCRARVNADLSARRSADSALKPATLIGIASLDRDHRITTWNAGCRDILGWQSEDVLGKELSAVLGSTAACLLEESLQVTREGRRTKPSRIPLRRWDGHEVATSIELLPLFDGPDDPVEIRLMIRDETDASHLTSLIEIVSAVSGLLEGSESAESVAEPILREICSGMGWLRGEWWQPEQAGAGWNLINQWTADQLSSDTIELQTNQGLDCELPELVREKRSIVRFEELAANSLQRGKSAAAQLGLHEAVGIPVLLDGELAGVMVFFGFEVPQLDAASSRILQAVAFQIATLLKQDRFAQNVREAEQNLVQTQKMEAVGLLAGGVAHDFNNLLTIILGFSEIALEMLDEDSPPAGMVREIEQAGHRAAALTRQLLTFSRKQPVEAVVFNVNARINDAEKMLRRLLDDRIELQFQRADTPPLIKFDTTQFEQVLMNLVVNARDAISGNGHIVVATGRKELSAASARSYTGGRSGDFIVVSVSDTGCGMDEATQARIFEPFFTTKEQGKGTGMGLATVYGIVNQCGGFLAIESEPGRGTTIGVFLPRAHELPMTMQVDAQLTAQSRGTESILLVEDEDILRSLAARMLESRGYTVLQAADAEEALRLLQRKRGRIDLLVSDVMMPGTTGPELVARMQSAKILLPVLFISGYVDGDRLGGVAPEADIPLLRKPFTSDGLAAAVRQLLDEIKTPRRPSITVTA